LRTTSLPIHSLDPLTRSAHALHSRDPLTPRAGPDRGPSGGRPRGRRAPDDPV